MAGKAEAMADVAANEAHEADEAGVAIKADEAYDAKANEAVGAIVANGSHEADETVEAKEAGKAIVANEAHEANETIEANEVANEVNQANIAN